jgi:hypothetical protein
MPQGGDCQGGIARVYALMGRRREARQMIFGSKASALDRAIDTRRWATRMRPFRILEKAVDDHQFYYRPKGTARIPNESSPSRIESTTKSPSCAVSQATTLESGRAFAPIAYAHALGTENELLGECAIRVSHLNTVTWLDLLASLIHVRYERVVHSNLILSRRVTWRSPTALHSLAFLVMNLPVMVSVNRLERVSNDVVSNSLSGRSPIVAGQSEVNTSEDARIPDFIQRR